MREESNSFAQYDAKQAECSEFLPVYELCLHKKIRNYVVAERFLYVFALYWNRTAFFLCIAFFFSKLVNFLFDSSLIFSSISIVPNCKFPFLTLYTTHFSCILPEFRSKTREYSWNIEAHWFFEAKRCVILSGLEFFHFIACNS